MGGFELILSEHILAETERTLLKPYFSERLSTEDREGILAFLRAEATLVPITAKVQGVAPSSDDDLVLATAVSAGAQYLVTGDRGLLAVESHQHVRIISVRDLLAIVA